MDQECDYNSPVGQIIKQINALCKKPKIDDELRSALELFSDKINHQKKFMNNGIFTINFAEAALFLQSCAELYGKKVDLLWDQLLEFHTRLIEYDCAHEKEKGKKVNDEVIKQLEERRNRYKRKKKFKLMLAQEDNLERFLFDKPINEDKDKLNTFEPDETLQRAWKSLEVESSKIKSVPNAVYKQQLTMYRMKNYYTMKSQDFDIFDAEDGEFNTKYSRVPGWHHIEHLFEYNTKGLLPDKNNLIATLRLGAYLRVKFLRDRKIPFSAPYTEYKEEYLAYRRQFFEAEGEKWQNMPLNTLDDLHKQLEFLSQKEQGIDDETEIDTHNVSSTSPNPDPGTGKETNSNVNHISDRNSLEKMLDECDDDSLFELSIGCPTELSNSDLFVRLEKLSSDIITKKYRQDSGFFGSDVDCDEEVNVHNTEVSAPVEMSTGGETIQNVSENRTEISDANLENSVMTAQNQKEDTAENGASTIPLMTDKLPENENLLGTVDTNHPHTVAMESVENCSAANTKSTQMFPANIDREQDKENLNPHAPNICDDTENLENSDDFETRSIMSDHSYCKTSSPRRVLEENNNVPIDKNVNAATKDVMTPFVSSRTRIIPRVVKTKPPREKVKFKVPAPNPSPPKRRKLSSKQVEKLFNSLIVAPAVKEMKFEKFFSQNYQPQLGEDIQYSALNQAASETETDV
nr:uncharacterized protein LOC111511484 [Leptinotarsa decemlineata]